MIREPGGVRDGGGVEQDERILIAHEASREDAPDARAAALHGGDGGDARRARIGARGRWRGGRGRGVAPERGEDPRRGETSAERTKRAAAAGGGGDREAGRPGEGHA